MHQPFGLYAGNDTQWEPLGYFSRTLSAGTAGKICDDLNAHGYLFDFDEFAYQ
jgi:hypothetical protein